MILITEVPTDPPRMGEGARTGWALILLAVLLASAIYCALSRWDAQILVDIPGEQELEAPFEPEVEHDEEGSSWPGDSL